MSKIQQNNLNIEKEGRSNSIKDLVERKMATKKYLIPFYALLNHNPSRDVMSMITAPLQYIHWSLQFSRPIAPLLLQPPHGSPNESIVTAMLIILEGKGVSKCMGVTQWTVIVEINISWKVLRSLCTDVIMDHCLKKIFYCTVFSFIQWNACVCHLNIFFFN